jgi:hypothetical protein
MSRMEITVTRDGRTTLTTHGFTGADCRAASRFMEQALGRASGECLTSEYHQTADEPVHEVQRLDDGRA